MKKLIFLYVLSATTLISSCTSDDDGAIYTKNYVMIYIEPTELMADDSVDSYGIVLNFEGQYIGQDDDGFAELAEKYGDTHYNRRTARYLHNAFTEDLEYINITSRTDYDATHLAGALLNDIVMVSFTQHYTYVQSNYKDWSKSSVADYISNINSANYKMIDPKRYLHLTFPTPPTDTSKEYTFDVEVKMGDKIFTQSYTRQFE